MPRKTPRIDPEGIPDEPAMLVQGRRNLTFPKCVATIQSLEDEGLTSGEFVALALAISHDNPEALIYCTLTIWPNSKPLEAVPN